MKSVFFFNFLKSITSSFPEKFKIQLEDTLIVLSSNITFSNLVLNFENADNSKKIIDVSSNSCMEFHVTYFFFYLKESKLIFFDVFFFWQNCIFQNFQTEFTLLPSFIFVQNSLIKFENSVMTNLSLRNLTMMELVSNSNLEISNFCQFCTFV